MADQIVDLDNAELSRDLHELRELEAAQPGSTPAASDNASIAAPVRWSS